MESRYDVGREGEGHVETGFHCGLVPVCVCTVGLHEYVTCLISESKCLIGYLPAYLSTYFASDHP